MVAGVAGEASRGASSSHEPLHGTAWDGYFRRFGGHSVLLLLFRKVPPAGFEPAPPPPEGGALSPELRGLGNRNDLSSHRWPFTNAFPAAGDVHPAITAPM